MKHNWDLRWSWNKYVRRYYDREKMAALGWIYCAGGWSTMGRLLGRMDRGPESPGYGGIIRKWNIGTMINWKVLNQYKVTHLIWIVMHLSQCQLFCNSTYVQSGEHFCQTQWLDTPTKTSMQTSSFNNRLKKKCLLREFCLFSVSTRPPLHPRTFGTIKLFKLFTSWPPRQLKLYIASLST